MAKVILKYSFIFDPSETWTNQFMFDSDLAAWIRSKGMEPEIVQTPKVPGSSNNERLIIINKVQEPVNPEYVKEKSLKEVRRDLSPNRGFDGKFKKI